MERKFEKGDIVILTSEQYTNIKKGTLGIVLEPITERRVLLTVHIADGVWSFKEYEFDLIA